MKKILAIVILLISGSASAQDHFNCKFLDKVNAFRAQNGLGPVEYSWILDSACKNHSDWMWQYNTLSHEESCPEKTNLARYSHQQRIWEFDTARQFETIYAGENVCRTTMDRGAMFGFTCPNDTVFDEMFVCWVNSPGHRAALLRPKVTHAAFAITAKCDPATGQFRAYSTCLLCQKIK